jgi:hypothetical protein
MCGALVSLLSSGCSSCDAHVLTATRTQCLSACPHSTCPTPTGPKPPLTQHTSGAARRTAVTAAVLASIAAGACVVAAVL